MGQIRLFSITFNNGTGPRKNTFMSGTLIEGCVTLELAELTKIKSINLKLRGIAFYRSIVAKKILQSTLTYFDKFYSLLGISPQGEQQVNELAAGVYNFPFQFQLPRGLPSSIEKTNGYVRYTAKATIDRPWKFDYTTENSMSIIAVVDLKQVPNSSKSCHETSYSNICCCCCQSGPIEATFHIEKTGFVLGEDIKLFAEISNGSNRKIKKSYVELIQLTEFTHVVTYNHESESTVIARVSGPGFAAHKDDAWSGEHLTVPFVAPSSLKRCQLVDVSYILQMTIVPAGPAEDIKIRIPIVLGTSSVNM